MKVRPIRVTEYLICIPEGFDPKQYFSGISSSSSDGEILCLAVNSGIGVLRKQTERFCRLTASPAGVLASPHRFKRARNTLLQAYHIAKKFKDGKAAFFDDIAHCTEYQSKYF